MPPVKKHLYKMSCIEKGWNYPVKEYDFLLVAAGHDFRAYEVLRKCEKHNVSLSNVLVFDYEERHSSMQSDNDSYESYKEVGFTCKSLTCSIQYPSECIKLYSKSELNFSKECKIGIDISCFNKPYFFSILKYLKEERQIDNVTVFYTEPMSYVFSKGLYNAYHSTFGPLSVEEIPGFPGNETGSTKKLLILLLGFDGELSSFIAEDVSPDRVIIVNGFPSYLPKFKDISLINNERLINYSGAYASIRYARANEPYETFNLLESIRVQEKDAFISVAPIGTKPMALGACMFATIYPGVRIVYPYPEKYAGITTDRCWYSWLYEIPLTV